MLVTGFVRKENLRNWGNSIMESAKAEGKNAGELAAESIETMLNDKTFTPDEFNFRSAFEALVNVENIDVSNKRELVAAVEASLLPKITQPMVSRAVKENYEYEASELVSLFQEEDANHSQKEDIVGILPAGPMRRRKQGAAFERVAPTDEQYTMWYRDFGLILDIDFETLMDDKNNLVTKLARDGGTEQGRFLSSLLCETFEMASTRNTFEESTSGTNSAYTRNGVSYSGHSSSTSAYFSTVGHTGIDGQTNINAITDTFSSAGVREGGKYLAKMKDTKSRAVKIVPNVLIGHDVLRQEMREFVGANNLYDSLEPTPNVWKGIRTVTSPYFSSDSRWWMGDPKKQGRIRWVERPKVTSWSIDKDAMERRVMMSFLHSMYLGAGWVDYRYLLTAGVSVS